MTIAAYNVRESEYLSFAVTVPHERMFEGRKLEMFDIRCYLYFTTSQITVLQTLANAERHSRLMEMASWAAVFVRERMKTYVSGLKTGNADSAPMYSAGPDAVAALKAAFGCPLGDFAEMKFGGNPELSVIGMAAIFGEEDEFAAYGETYKKKRH